MKQALGKKNFSGTSLPRDRSPRTVLLRMAADDARAQRIQGLKAERPDLTWKKIADRIPVSERAVHAWRKTGALSYENARKLAAVFEVDADWL